MTDIHSIKKFIKRASGTKITEYLGTIFKNGYNQGYHDGQARAEQGFAGLIDNLSERLNVSLEAEIKLILQEKENDQDSVPEVQESVTDGESSGD